VKNLTLLLKLGEKLDVTLTIGLYHNLYDSITLGSKFPDIQTI